MLFVLNAAGPRPANVYLTISGTHTSPADQNVLSMQTVHLINSVEIFIVLTRVQDYVVPMPTVRWLAIFLSVCVTRVILEIHLLPAAGHHQVSYG